MLINHYCQFSSALTWTSSLKSLVFVLLLISMTSFSGCNYFVPLGYLIGGPPSIEPDFDAMTKKSMTDKDITVVVMAYAPPELKWDFPKIDHELSRYVAYRLTENHVKVISPDQVQRWLDEHQDWDKPGELAKACGDVDYVVYIDMGTFDLYEENSTTLYRGRSECYVSVFEIDAEGGSDKIYSHVLASKYPIRAPRSTSEMPLTTFKKQYLARLSEEIGWLFYEHYNGDDIKYAM